MKSAPVVVILLLASPVLAQSVEEQFQRSREAYHQSTFGQEHATFLKEIRPLAELGYAPAQYLLGIAFSDGRGVTGDQAKAAYWFSLAAEQGDAHAQNALGLRYLLGSGVPQDIAEAVRCYTRAAENGNTSAQTTLALRYEKGRGVLQDYDTAIHWYCEAVRRKSALALRNLGWMHERGQGVAQDNGRAHMYFNLANAKPDYGLPMPLVVESRKRVAEKMTCANVSKAQRLAREWTPDKPCP
jgi:TPR repeat protein